METVEQVKQDDMLKMLSAIPERAFRNIAEQNRRMRETLSRITPMQHLSVIEDEVKQLTSL